jgi:hypothetical protein
LMLAPQLRRELIRLLSSFCSPHNSRARLRASESFPDCKAARNCSKTAVLCRPTSRIASTTPVILAAPVVTVVLPLCFEVICFLSAVRSYSSASNGSASVAVPQLHVFRTLFGQFPPVTNQLFPDP